MLQTAVDHIDAELSRDPAASMRGKILALEAVMLAMPAEQQIQIETKHYFANGLYMREIFIPKGVVLTGKIHKTEHLCVLSLGEVSVWNGDTPKPQRLTASTVVKSSPGVKRVIFAHQDSIWINAHFNPTNEQDLDKIEDIYIAKSFDEIPGLAVPKELEESK